ncbi:DHBP synthase RibB-like alpha/beta domain-containing protein [Mortierella sp. GBAus27b]|nr:DHBP synthase RibB-like alpha/beta domain-containing protein [Mortierella sp. GBAus27b]
MPTETVYGLAANTWTLQEPAQDNPLIVHVASLKMLRSILKDQQIPAVYSDLIKTYWPGPLTLLFPRSSLIPDEITCGQATVAVRFPSQPITRALIWACGLPLAAPSANSSGKPSPTLASHVMDDLHGKIPMVINDGQCSFGIESTVVDGLRAPPAILRPGGVTFEQIREVPGMEQAQMFKKHFTDAAMEQAPTTPRMKYRHYSPEAEVVLVDPTATNGDNGGHVNGSSSGDDSGSSCVIEFPLGQGSRPDDVARELFRGLRHLDVMNVDCIFVEGISDQDEGLAVMDRVHKAASRTISLESTTFL